MCTSLKEHHAYLDNPVWWAEQLRLGHEQYLQTQHARQRKHELCKEQVEKELLRIKKRVFNQRLREDTSGANGTFVDQVISRSYVYTDKYKKGAAQPPTLPLNFHLSTIKHALAEHPDNTQDILDHYLHFLGHVMPFSTERSKS
jgi:hypothetical protein